MSNYEEDAQAFKDAFKGWGSDEDKIINLLANRTNEQRQQILLAYKSSFGSDLIDDIKSELGGDFETVAVDLFKTPVDYDVDILYKAMKGLGTDEDALIEIIGTRSAQRLTEVKERYKEVHGNELEDDIKGETSGDFCKLLVSLLQCNRDDSHHVDHDKVKEDTVELVDAGEGSWGTDESVFNKILAIRSPKHIKAVMNEYATLSPGNKTFEEALESELSGDFLALCKTIVHALSDPHEYFADRIQKACKGWGTNDHMLIRTIISRDEIDIQQINEVYLLKYNQSLKEQIECECSGSYKKILIELTSK